MRIDLSNCPRCEWKSLPTRFDGETIGCDDTGIDLDKILRGDGIYCGPRTIRKRDSYKNAEGHAHPDVENG
jgi:hypothetical protein